MRYSQKYDSSLICYFNYLEHIQDKGLNTISPVKKKLLDLVFTNTKNGVSWTVTQYLYAKKIGSFMTIHKNIHELIADNYLTINFLVGKRNKTVLLSDKGIALINDFGLAIQTSTRI